MIWKPRSLGSLLEKSGFDRAGNNDYPVLSMTMKHGLVDQSEKFKKRVASRNTAKYLVAYKNELVVGFPIDEGVLGFQTQYPAGIVSPAYKIWKLKDISETYIPYLELYLRSPQARWLYASKMQGAVARRRSLTNTVFSNLNIPFPPLDDQKRIVHVLSKVKRIIAQRKQHLLHLDDLLKSIFIDMFGDPVRNDNKWEMKSCDKVVVNIQSGTSYSGEEKEELDSEEYGVLKISAVTQGDFKPHEFKAVKKAAIKKTLRFVKKGDLLFSRANTLELVAACCVVNKDFDNLFLPDKLWALTLDESVNIQYFNFLLKNESFRNLMRKQASGGHDSMLNISMKKFYSLSIPIPNQNTQNKFSAIVEKVEDIKDLYQQSLVSMENLYGALSQKAFKGELDLSRIVLPADQSDTTDEKVELESVPIEQETEKQMNLSTPDIDQILNLDTSEGRKITLEQWLNEYLEQCTIDAPFLIEEFMEAAQRKLGELNQDGLFEPEEDSALELGVAEYDQLKGFIFEELKSGRWKQKFDEESKRVQLFVSRGNDL